MRKIALFVGSTLAVLVATAPVMAQVTAPVQTTTTWRVKNLLGTRVMLQNNTVAGTIDDVILDQNGQVDYIVASNDGKLYTIPWQAATFNNEQRTAVINLTPQQFQTVPTYTTTTYPSFYTPAYQESIYKVYGLTPGQARRQERRIERRIP